MPELTIKVTVELPDWVPGEAAESARTAAREAAVLALWEGEEISTRVAAKELEIGYQDFIELLAKRNIPAERGPLTIETEGS